ncbi:flavanone 3-dioxygenase 3 [Henckelia pumila]|uniref:flavanone 3-dioxygenase 3 n=1 Tax=Henckelia pumila TaxID=405737 RepID=UPI003C6E029B
MTESAKNERDFESSHDQVQYSSGAGHVPLISLDGMCNPARRPIVVEQIANACLRKGFFQVINHGISQQILDGALCVASDFFNLPTQDKAKLLSPDIRRPVRYSTSFKAGGAAAEAEQAQSWRAFLKHYANPLPYWIGLWPQNPPLYREKIGEYVVEIQKLALKLMGAITESLGLGPTYLSSKLNEGMQVMSLNCYPPCPQPQHSLIGIPQHTDYSCLTILLQDSPGLQILDSGDHGSWRAVPAIHGALQVHVGDHLEVLSNGKYKSVLHRVTVRAEGTRISIASLHSLGMNVKMEVAGELVDEQNPERYKSSSFGDFLNFASKNELGEGTSFLDSLKFSP